MIWVLRRITDGKFVTPPGSPHSYTSDLMRAMRFSSEAAANIGKCGNEVAVKYEDAT